MGGPLVGALILAGAHQLGDFRLHQGLGEHLDAFSQHVPVVFFQQLANERRQIHPGLGHPSSPFRVCPFSPKNSRETLRDGRFAV